MLATVPPESTITTTSNRRRLSSFEHLNGQEDYHRMYSASERRWSTRSVSSFNTDDGAGSTNTEQMSNTVLAREKKQREKRRFLSFTKVLMKFLEKKNPTVCKNARNVILKYCKSSKNNKEHGVGQQYCGEEDESESMCESIMVPLKQTVGSAYWKQAKGYLNQMEAKEEQENNRSSCNEHGGTGSFEPLSLDSTTGSSFGGEIQVESLSYLANSNVIADDSKRSCQKQRSCPRPSTNENQLVVKERKLRKQRFWMVVKVLMRYIEKKDSELYKKARRTLEDCEKRNVQKEPRFTNLIESVQRELKQTVGTRYWRRAEHHVSKHLLKNAREKALEDALVSEASSFGPLDDFTQVALLEEQPQEQPIVDLLSLEATFVPPRNSTGNWRDPSIPINVAIPTKRPAEDWRMENDYQTPDSFAGFHGEPCTSDDGSFEKDTSMVTEMNRKRPKLWCRPHSHFSNGEAHHSSLHKQHNQRI